MIGNRIPRFLLYATVLAAVVAVVMLTLFYGQYRWLARQIVSASYQEHRVLLQGSYERRARAELHHIADQLSVGGSATDSATLNRTLNHALAENPALNGLRLTTRRGEVFVSGDYPQGMSGTKTTWLDEQMLLSYPVVRDEVEAAQVSGSFDLATFHADLAKFTDQLQAKEDESRRVSFLWIGGGSLAVLLLCGGVFWVLVWEQTQRIRQLKAQAERFRDADFGEPLPVRTGDELGALAQVFNDMRDKLRTTTHSRDYVDSILSGMNEAIIVTTDDGRIVRTNTATTYLLGYDEDELCGTSIDFIVDKKKCSSLANDTPSGLPREAIFESKHGESIPVSYTCSIVKSDGEGSNRIYAAHASVNHVPIEPFIRS